MSNTKKFAFLSLGSLFSCMFIGALWAWFLLAVMWERSYDAVESISDAAKKYNDEMVLLFYFIATFILVNVIYFVSERYLKKYFSSRTKFVLGFVLIPLVLSVGLTPVSLAAVWIFSADAIENGPLPAVIGMAALAPALSAIAYAMILPSLLVRLIFEKIKGAVIK